MTGHAGLAAAGVRRYRKADERSGEGLQGYIIAAADEFPHAGGSREERA